ncbi:hypothetical protein FRB90_011311 [Tulasnella sp. 427]|nr:hypothetical protein FRB90_011311 [Tulasnella sp. 427]
MLSRARCTVNDLPNEVLSAIFILTLHAWLPRRDICRLELTCRRWYEVVETTPVIWANITILEGMNYVEQALRKSKNAPIDIKFVPRGPSLDFADFSSRIDPHISRWRSLTATLRELDLGALETTPAPQLESLKVTFNGELIFPRPRYITMFGAGWFSEKLRNVEIDRFPLDIDGTSLRNLSSLKLNNVDVHSSSMIMFILGASPQLVCLSLHGLPIHSPDEVTYAPINLLVLERVSIQQIGIPATSLILSTIRAPNCIHLTIHCTLTHLPSHESELKSLLTPELSHLHPVIRKMARGDDSVKVRETSNGMNEVAIGAFTFGMFTLGVSALSELVDWTLRVLDGPGGGEGGVLRHPRPVTFESEEGYYPPCYFESEFSSKITELNLVGPRRTSRRMDAEHRPNDGGGGALALRQSGDHAHQSW